MANLLSKVAIVGIVLIGILYQLIFKTIIFDIMGYGRVITSIKAFPHFRCEKVDELGLEACEEFWLHNATGYLYMACSDSQSRTQWFPPIDNYDASGRGLTDRIAVLDTRGSGRLATRIQWLSLENFSGINGDGTINLHGFDIREDPHTHTLRILLVNHRPPVDPLSGKPLDHPTNVGANSTIEQFQTQAGSDAMRHVRTYAHPLIQTPNDVAWVNDHAFVFTNDHSGKVGLRRSLDPLLGGGSIGYCDRNRCNIAYSSKMKGPNGIVRGRDGLIYVPNTISTGRIDVFSLNEDHTLKKVNEINAGLPIDNLSVDQTGDIFAAAIPQMYKWAASAQAPFDVHPPSTVLRIRRGGKGYRGRGRQGHLEFHEAEYVVEKVLEDDGSVLPGTTIAVHDAVSGRMFLGGAVSPFISICEAVT